MKDRRSQFGNEPWNQYSDTYRDELCRLVRDLKLCPEAVVDIICEQVIRPNSDCFWIEGAPTPLIKEHQAVVRLKQDTQPKLRQPYALSKFDEARVSYHVEEQLREGKIRPWTHQDPTPKVVTPVFMVGDYTGHNQVTLDEFWPSTPQSALQLGSHTYISAANDLWQSTLASNHNS